MVAGEEKKNENWEQKIIVMTWKKIRRLRRDRKEKKIIKKERKEEKERVHQKNSSSKRKKKQASGRLAEPRPDRPCLNSRHQQ